MHKGCCKRYPNFLLWYLNKEISQIFGLNLCDTLNAWVLFSFFRFQFYSLNKTPKKGLCLTRVVVCYVNIRYNIPNRKSMFKSFILALNIATNYVRGISKHISFFLFRMSYPREKKRYRKSRKGGM